MDVSRGMLGGCLWGSCGVGMVFVVGLGRLGGLCVAGGLLGFRLFSLFNFWLFILFQFYLSFFFVYLMECLGVSIRGG